MMKTFNVPLYGKTYTVKSVTKEFRRKHGRIGQCNKCDVIFDDAPPCRVVNRVAMEQGCPPCSQSIQGAYYVYKEVDPLYEDLKKAKEMDDEDN
jgi:hypothetical protein